MILLEITRKASARARTTLNKRSKEKNQVAQQETHLQVLLMVEGRGTLTSQRTGCLCSAEPQHGFTSSFLCARVFQKALLGAEAEGGQL